MKPKLLLLDNYDSFTYNLVQIIAEIDTYDLHIYKNDEIELEEVQKFDKILLSPGPDTPSQAGKMNKIIEEYAPQRSILGICLGHQAIAEVFGATLEQVPIIAHGITREIEVLDRKNMLFQNLPKKFEVGVYHSWVVSQEDFPEDLKVTAQADNLLMAITHQSLDVQGLQFHPESFLTPFGKQILENWLKL